MDWPEGMAGAKGEEHMTRIRPDAMACAAMLFLVPGCFFGYGRYGPAYRTYRSHPREYRVVREPAGPARQTAAPKPPLDPEPVPLPRLLSEGAEAGQEDAETVSPRASSAGKGGKVVAGFNAGFMISEGIGPGADITYTYRMSDFVGIRFSVGQYELSDTDYKASLMPVLVRAVFSTPLRWSKSHRTCVSLGGGFLIADESEGYFFPPTKTHSKDPVYVIEYGREHVMDNSRTARMMAGIFINNHVGGLIFSFGMDFGR